MDASEFASWDSVAFDDSGVEGSYDALLGAVHEFGCLAGGHGGGVVFHGFMVLWFPVLWVFRPI